MVKQELETRQVMVYTCEGCGLKGTDFAAIKAHEWDRCEWPYRKVAPFPSSRKQGRSD